MSWLSWLEHVITEASLMTRSIRLHSILMNWMCFPLQVWGGFAPPAKNWGVWGAAPPAKIFVWTSLPSNCFHRWQKKHCQLAMVATAGIGTSSCNGQSGKTSNQMVTGHLFSAFEGCTTSEKSDKFGIEIGIEVGMPWGSVKKSVRGGKPPSQILAHSLKSFQLQFQFQFQIYLIFLMWCNPPVKMNCRKQMARRHLQVSLSTKDHSELQTAKNRKDSSEFTIFRPKKWQRHDLFFVSNSNEPCRHCRIVVVTIAGLFADELPSSSSEIFRRQYFRHVVIVAATMRPMCNKRRLCLEVSMLFFLFLLFIS